MNIEPVIAALGDRYDPAEAAEIERVLRAYNGTIPDAQLLSEASLALAIWRRGRGQGPTNTRQGALIALRGTQAA